MNAWTDLATVIVDLLPLAAATINLIAAILARPRHRHDRPDGSQ